MRTGIAARLHPFMRHICFVALTGLSLAQPAHAGLFDDEEARKRIEQLRTDLGETGKRYDALNRNQLDFVNQLETLRTDIARLRGQVEVLAFELDAAQKRQKDFYVDLDNRLRKLEQPPPEVKPEKPKVDPAAETRDYENALGLLKNSKFIEAANGFAIFIDAWPESTLQASAHYWCGYANAQARDHVRAAECFGKFAADWPSDERAPVALESQVASLEAIKDAKGAKAALELLADKYPNSEAGKRAKLRLKRK